MMLTMNLIKSKRSVGWFWGAMDAFYICFVVFSSLRRGVTPFLSDLNAALANMERWGGGLELMVWMGLIAQASLVVSGTLLCLGKLSGVYLAGVQTPFRFVFVIPSLSVILVLPDTRAWIWLSLLCASEGAKVWSLWWLWRRRE